EDINSIDRWVAGNYSPEADELSYIPFYGSFAMPFVMMLTKNERNHAGQISMLFLETMATTGALYTISAGTVARSRPLVYNENVPLDERLESGAQRSWFGGHTAATAAATFFTAKVFADFNPDSWAKPYIWAAAIAIPAWVAYLRTISGKHFLTDNLTGYAVGALSGILIPELHKKKNSDINFSTFVGDEYKGFSLSYSF
ncbi:MAG TPA: phosphatase PAP2 family protein, partial [Salinimicrobium sp.]|nr:phosphatase PAP2 family protein [Salinimicrobium sp.]